jgi:hypothetical protein
VDRSSRRFAYATDGAVIAVAALVSSSSSGLPRILALVALGLALLLLAARSGIFAGVVAGSSRRRAARLALLGAVAALVVGTVALRSVTPRLEPLPFESPDLSHLPSGTRACLEKRAVEAYLQNLHGDLIRAWPAFEKLPAAQQVVIEFTLLPSGEASNPVVVASSFQGMGRAALDALARITPLEPLGPEVDCLRGVPVRLSLSNPGE